MVMSEIEKKTQSIEIVEVKFALDTPQVPKLKKMKLSIWHLKTQRHFDSVAPPVVNKIQVQKLLKKFLTNLLFTGKWIVLPKIK